MYEKKKTSKHQVEKPLSFSIGSSVFSCESSDPTTLRKLGFEFFHDFIVQITVKSMGFYRLIFGDWHIQDAAWRPEILNDLSTAWEGIVT